MVLDRVQNEGARNEPRAIPTVVSQSTDGDTLGVDNYKGDYMAGVGPDHLNEDAQEAGAVDSNLVTGKESENLTLQERGELPLSTIVVRLFLSISSRSWWGNMKPQYLPQLVLLNTQTYTSYVDLHNH